MKKNLEKILVPVHYSEPAYHAAWFGLNIARATHAQMTLMHIHVRERALRELVSLKKEDVAELTDDKFEKLLNQIVSDPSLSALQSVVDHSEVEFAELSTKYSLSEEICRYAKDNQIDLIVVGSEYLTVFEEIIIGSVSQDVIHKAPCPVTVVH